MEKTDEGRGKVTDRPELRTNQADSPCAGADSATDAFAARAECTTAAALLILLSRCGGSENACTFLESAGIIKSIYGLPTIEDIDFFQAGRVVSDEIELRWCRSQGSFKVLELGCGDPPGMLEPLRCRRATEATSLPVREGGSPASKGEILAIRALSYINVESGARQYVRWLGFQEAI